MSLSTNINNGVYRCGFATTQEAYEEAYNSLFDALDKVEAQLATHRYLTGDQITEADLAIVYHISAFRCGVCGAL